MMHVLSKHTVSIPVLNRRVPGTGQATESSRIVTGHRDFGPNGQEVIHMFQVMRVSGRAEKEDKEVGGARCLTRKWAISRPRPAASVLSFPARKRMAGNPLATPIHGSFPTCRNA